MESESELSPGKQIKSQPYRRQPKCDPEDSSSLSQPVKGKKSVKRPANGPAGNSTPVKRRKPKVEPTSDDDSEVMTKAHKDRLLAKRHQLVENVMPDDVINQLVSSRVLTSRDKDRIESKTNRMSKVETLLDIIGVKSDGAFKEFTEALNATRQKHMAKLLKDAATPEKRTSPRSKASSAAQRSAASKSSSVSCQRATTKKKTSNVSSVDTQPASAARCIQSAASTDDLGASSSASVSTKTAPQICNGKTSTGKNKPVWMQKLEKATGKGFDHVKPKLMLVVADVKDVFANDNTSFSLLLKFRNKIVRAVAYGMASDHEKFKELKNCKVALNPLAYKVIKPKECRSKNAISDFELVIRKVPNKVGVKSGKPKH